MPQPTAAADEVGWNHNVHYQRLVLEAVPAGASRALDAGCGEGILSAALARAVPHVVGLDADAEVLDRTRSHRAGHVDLVRGDLVDPPFPPASFDVVASIATLHHVDARAGLTALADLVRPGGVLAVVGLARADLPWDLPYELAGGVATRVHQRTKPYREVQAPTVWPPPLTYRQLRSVAQEVLPGVRYRRHAMWRCSLVWVRPHAGHPGRGAPGGPLTDPSIHDATWGCDGQVVRSMATARARWRQSDRSPP